MGKGQSIAGLVLGIVALLLSFAAAAVIPTFIALPLSIVGLVLSVVGGKKAKANGAKSGIATAGLVIGIIAVVFSAITFLSCGLCGICVMIEAAAAGTL